jgi:pimeloyl-ACP methyl ester carboxylesterase
MHHHILKCLLLFSLLKFGEISGEFSGLSDNIKEDLFAIYTHAALLERNITREPVTPDKVEFVLFTENNPKNYTKIDPSNPTELNNTEVRIVFIIHGWLENRGKEWYEDLKNAFLNKKEKSYYVVQVDWSEPALQGYMVSAYNTKDVGNIVGQLIVDLHKKYSVPLANILVVGHSLGGQISGYVGRKVKESTNKKLARIVALDPAGPLFINRPENERLNKDDAEIVHVIHTNGGTFGFFLSCGTIDFFPNGGSTQTGCATINLLDPTSIAEPVVCNHQRSWKYFIEAVEYPEEFQGRKCKTWASYLAKTLCDEEYAGMGDVDTKKTGEFYLTTNNESPYYKQRSLLERHFAFARM